MKSRLFEEEIIYSTEQSQLNERNYETIKKAIKKNYSVGFLTGFYDEALSISNTSGFFLHNLGYTYEEFMEATSGSLRNLFYGNPTFMKLERFRKIQGEGEGRMLTKDGTPVYVRMVKLDSVDENGTPFWILSVQTDWMQQNLHLVNEVIRSGFWYIDCDSEGNAVRVVFSSEFRQMLGFGDILDFPNRMDSWEKLLHPDDREQAVQLLADALADRSNRTKYEIEYRIKMKDGSYQWFQDSAEVERRTDGTARRMVGVFINIDEKKRAQQKAQISDAFHRAFTEGNLCEYYVDIKTNSFQSLKKEDPILEKLGFSSTWDEFIRFYIEQFVIEEDREAVRMTYDPKYIEQKIAEGIREISLECRIMVQGEAHWVRNVIIRDDAIDASRYAIVFIRDITEAKENAARIQDLVNEKQALDLLVQGTVKLVDRYAMCDLKQNRYRFYDRTRPGTEEQENSFAYAPTGRYQDLVACIMAQFKMVSEEESIEQALAPDRIEEILQTPEDVYRFEYCTLDEKQFKALAISPLSWKDGKVERVLLLAQDTTQEKLAEIESRKALKDAYEAANRASRAKTDFLSNMSHDIRTPMNAIVGMTAIAGANIDNQERVQDCLSKITQSSRHLLSLINEVLDMSRIESGKIALTEEEFNLSDLMDNLIAMVKSGIDQHHHEFDVHINKIEHEDVCGDSLRIQQMITNILSNAIKYTPEGGRILFTISEIPTQSQETGCYEFVVEDNGIGMTPEFQKIIFDPFTRADDKRTSRIQGTGLGMAIAENFAHMMNGDIRVESQPGKGSKFTTTIFLKLQDKKMDKIEELIELPVLVVDDDRICCENTVELLNEIGIDGEWVTSGEEAIVRAMDRYEKNETYFAIIIDWKMPGMDGIETTRQLRKRLGKEVTIIILTAYDYSDIEQEAREAGVDEFIAKPLFRSRLVAALKHVIEGKPEQQTRGTLYDFAKSDYTGKRVLLVEDNELNSEIAREIIGMTGAEVVTAENGKEAVDKFAASLPGEYDLIFMDIQMPIMNGYQAAAGIRSMNRTDAQQVPIVAMTANAFAEDVVLAKNAGMNEHIAKPLDIHRLQEVMKRWL